ncbi:MAG: alpha/beta fold hydrolase [Alphaproteobacteria bacterium]|nr:alpha/beta fold hydrolase [Alphaproteobacteria bacterium]
MIEALAGLRWHFLTNDKGYQIRAATIMPHGKAKGCVLLLHGLSEFTEKYYEVITDLIKRDMMVVTFDWVGQGGSENIITNSQKRHTQGFDQDVADIDKIYHELLIPLLPKKDFPKYMIAHSMGGHLGLRYLAEGHADNFAAAAFSAPMLGIASVEAIAAPIRKRIFAFAERMLDKSYVPGGTDWTGLERAMPGHSIFSSDKERDSWQNAWCKKNEKLKDGAATWGWLREAYKSCQYMAQEDILKRITTPVFIAYAGKEALVSNNAITTALKIIPRVKGAFLPLAKHEILMESNNIRNQFWAGFDIMISNLATHPH